MTNNNLIIHASAGSGKTYQLSKRYIAELLRSDDVAKTVNEMFASTFTCKALAEILDRIMKDLSEAAIDAEKHQELQKALTEELNLLEQIPSQSELQTIVAKIAKELYRIHISTLDSFFNKIASSFALQLQIPPGWSILDDDAGFNRVIKDAINETLPTINKTSDTEEKTLLNLMQKGEEKTSVFNELTELAKDLLPLVRATTLNQWPHD